MFTEYPEHSVMNPPLGGPFVIVPPITETIHQNQSDCQQYVIAWHNPDTNCRMDGRGTKRMSRTEAEALAAELNTDYPRIKHSIALACALFLAVILCGCQEAPLPPPVPTPAMNAVAVTNVHDLKERDIAIVVVGGHRIAVIGSYRAWAICEVTDASLVNPAHTYVTNIQVWRFEKPEEP